MGKIIANLVLLLIFLTACQEENDPFYFDNKGVLNGYVSLNNSITGEEVTVQMRGANYNQTMVTELDGRYEFRNLPTSNYHLTFTKEGYGVIRVYNIRQSGVDTVVNMQINMFRIPQVSALKLIALEPGVWNGNAYIDLQFQEESGRARGRAFFSLSPDVSFDNYEFSGSIDNDETLQSLTFSAISAERFSGGQKVYFKIYPNGGGAYFDFQKDLWIYSAVNPTLASPTYEFIFPE